jgi:hypothetical protein
MLLFFFSTFFIQFSKADEGMWPPSLINSAIFEQMKAKGFLLTPEAIYSTTQPSLKDAVVLFGRGCTAEIISNQGLILTNHHCGHSQIQSHSSIEHDYLQNGFWAKNQKEELANPGLSVSILVRMEDVTNQAIEGISPTLSDKEKNTAIDANLKKIGAKAIAGTHYQYQIKPFFGGLQQWMIVYETFTDIRLVGAPPSSIGKFGGDTDNWVWPRHTGDFSLFRIYAGKDNKPATYSPDNQPYTPKKFLPISTTGIKEGDFTMVVGYPGRTNEYLPSFALEVVTQVINPKKIALRTKRLDVINAAMKSSQEKRIKYASTQADIANAWKKWQGESLGMAKADAIGSKRKVEERYKTYFSGKGQEGKMYLDALENLKSGYEKMRTLRIPAEYQSEAVLVNDFFSIIKFTKTLYQKDPKQDPKLKAKQLEDYKASIRYIWKDTDVEVERALFKVYMEAYRKDIPDQMHAPEFLEMVAKFPIESGQFQKEFFDKGKWFDSTAVWKIASKVLKGDSNILVKSNAYKLMKVLQDQYIKTFSPAFLQVATSLEINNQIFFNGLMEMEKTRQFYPDANQTFRVAFGNVAGYKPKDGVQYTWQSTTAGILEKADTEFDFMLENGLKEKYKTQNNSKEGPVPVAFIASNHSTGGNSGSPVLNAKGELIGVNFDRVWEGTMSDYYFDSRICRNITCDIGYVLWVIDKVGDSKHLVKEMDLR